MRSRLSRLKRRWARLVLALAVGAAAPYLVSWGLLASSSEGNTTNFAVSGEGRRWIARHWRASGADQLLLLAVEDGELAPSLGDWGWYPTSPHESDLTEHAIGLVAGDDRDVRLYTVWYAGWPLRCLVGWGEQKAMDLSGPFPRFANPDLRFALLVDSTVADIPGMLRLLPLRPIWFPFMAQSVFLALLAWLLASIPSWLVRLFRRRRSRCVDCGYSLHDTDVCPECGRVRCSASRQSSTRMSTRART